MKLKKFKKPSAKPVTKAAPKKSKSEVPPLKLKQTDTVTKVPVSIRLDENIVTYFKDQYPKGYQSEINRVLSDYVTENA